MYLLQKKYQIQPAYQRKFPNLLAINSCYSVIIYPQSVQLYNSDQKKIVSEQKLRGKEQINKNIEQIKETQHKIYSEQIIASQYHLGLKCVIIVIAIINDGQINWKIGYIKCQEQLILAPIQIFWDFSKHPTKYESMQLQPRIICLHKAQSIVLIRQFYNDSQIVIFDQYVEKQNFFINQECISSFDDEHTLVNYRQYFKNKIQINLIDSRQKLSNSKKYRIDLDGTGVVMSVKKMKNSDQILLAINWKTNVTEFIIYDCESDEIILSKKLQDQKIMYYFWFGSQSFICLMKERNVSKLKLFTVKANKISIQYQLESKLNYEEWNSFITQENQPIVLNYTEDRRTGEFFVESTRIVGKKQCYISVLSSYFNNQCDALIQQVYSQLTQ